MRVLEPKSKVCLTSFSRSFFLVFLCIVFLANAASGEQSQHKVRLQLKWRHQFQFAGYYTAIAKGFYRDAGIEVEILEARSDKEPAETVIEGNAEFGIAGSDLILLRGLGRPVVALAAIYQHSPMVFLTSAESGINNIHQLVGKRVMLESHSAELLAYLNAEGIRESDLQLMPHSFGVNDLLAGNVDVISAYLSDETFILKEKGIAYNLFMPQSSGIDFYSDVLFTTEEQIINYPERVKAFVDATSKGWQYALSHQEEIVDLIWNKYSQRHSRAHLLFEAEKSRQLILPEVVDIGYMTTGRWQHIADKYQELGMLHTDVDLQSFIFRPEVRRESIIRQAIKFGEIFFALVALGFVIRLIRSFTSLEALDRQNRKMNRKLEKSRRRYSLLLRNMPGMAYKCLLDDDWTMLYASHGAYRLTGYSAASLCRKQEVNYARLIHEKDRETVTKTVHEAYLQKKSFKISYRIIDAKGKEKWVWEQGQFSGETHNELPVVEGFVTDVSEAKKLEEECQQLITDLQLALRENKALRGILPICSSCKMIRDENGSWKQMESYICENTNTEFSHVLCPICAQKTVSGVSPECVSDLKPEKNR